LPFARTHVLKWPIMKGFQTMTNDGAFRVLLVNLGERKSKLVEFGDPEEHLGGSGLAAALFSAYGHPELPANHPDQPLIFAIGPLTGYFPLMSKTVLAFKSPYHEQYAESHAGGRFALALRFAGYDALVITGAAATPSVLEVGGQGLRVHDVHYLWGKDVFATGKWLRRIHKGNSGRRSILRIGPAGERQVAYASINVDTYRHFGRLGGGAIMGAKNLKGIIALGDGSLSLPEGKAYARLYQTIYQEITGSSVMRKYHDLGTLENMLPLNEMAAVPWRNLTATRDENAYAISGERFGDDLLLRQTACAGCPVGCIHVGLVRERFGSEHEFLYRQVSYDHEPVFAAGSMLGITNAEQVLMLLEETERQGVDVISAGVALAWATEALERGLITEQETLSPLKFGWTDGYQQAIRNLGERANDFYHLLGQGTQAAAAHYGGGDFACVLGQEMAGYATGEVYFVSQAYGFRHSHLDSAGYSYDQKPHEKDEGATVRYLLEEERRRVGLTCMVSCLFARNVYTEERLQEGLSAIGHAKMAQGLQQQSKAVQARRWQLKFQTGYDPARIVIPKRFKEVQTWRGPIDESFMARLGQSYQKAITELAQGSGS
jgi:aldehyde:ferredoxin oxidoreductase